MTTTPHKHNQKTTTFYVVRHGQTDWNVKNIVQGHEDILLNDVGRSESQLLSKALSQTTFAACFSSDLKRAHETAQIVIQNRSLTVKTDPRLRERCFGPDWQGRPFTEYLQSHPDQRKGIESESQMQNRILEAMHDIAVQHPDSPVLVVTHGGVMRQLLAHVLAYDLNHHDISAHNNGVAKLGFLNGQWEVHELQGIELKKKGSHVGTAI